MYSESYDDYGVSKPCFYPKRESNDQVTSLGAVCWEVGPTFLPVSETTGRTTLILA